MLALTPLQEQALALIAELEPRASFEAVVYERGVKRSTIRALERRGLIRFDYPFHTLTEDGRALVQDPDEESDL